jgi:hypothetical protein
LILGLHTIGAAQSSEFKKMGFREALNKGIDKEEKKSLKNDFINKMTFEFKSNGKFVGSSLEP